MKALLEQYERIADAPDAIARLRRFILDLAVRGKLVPQDRNDEPASELLKRIAKEKARLVKAGEIRRDQSTVRNRPRCLPDGTAHRLGCGKISLQQRPSTQFSPRTNSRLEPASCTCRMVCCSPTLPVWCRLSP